LVAEARENPHYVTHVKHVTPKLLLPDFRPTIAGKTARLFRAACTTSIRKAVQATSESPPSALSDKLVRERIRA
jgi:hypothetical protein